MKEGGRGGVRAQRVSLQPSLIKTQKTPHTSGDASAEFRLAAFFPAPVTPVVDAMAGVCDRAIQAVARAKVGADGAGGGGAAAPGGGKVDDAAAQRRR